MDPISEAYDQVLLREESVLFSHEIDVNSLRSLRLPSCVILSFPINLNGM